MREQLESRLAQLKAEYESDERMLAEIEQQRALLLKGGVAVNDDVRPEREADVMEAKAMQRYGRMHDSRSDPAAAIAAMRHIQRTAGQFREKVVAPAARNHYNDWGMLYGLAK